SPVSTWATASWCVGSKGAPAASTFVTPCRSSTSASPLRTSSTPSTIDFPFPPPRACSSARSRLSTTGRRSRMNASLANRTASARSRALRFLQFSSATAAFVIRTRPYGESDRIVTLITETQGKVTGIAKGAKNSRRRFAGTLEPFVHIRTVFRQRPSSDLAFLVRCEFLGAFRRFTSDLERFAAGSYVLELTDRMVLGRESGREVYRLVADVLELLDAGTPIEPVLRAFELHLLAASGYARA